MFSTNAHAKWRKTPLGSVLSHVLLASGADTKHVVTARRVVRRDGT